MVAPASSNGYVAKHAIAVDVVLFTIQGGTLKVLLVKRQRAPYRGAWALPGGIVGPDESVDAAALRANPSESPTKSATSWIAPS